jgi:hypothetical protein
VICRNIYIWLYIYNHISYDVFISSYILHHIPPTTSPTGRYYNLSRIIRPTAIEIRWLSSEHGRGVEADRMINSSREPWKKIRRRNDQCTEPMILEIYIYIWLYAFIYIYDIWYLWNGYEWLIHQPLIWWDPNSAHQSLENKSAVGPYVHPPARCVHSGCPGAGRRKKCAASAIKWGIEHIRTWTPERFGGLLGTIIQGFFSMQMDANGPNGSKIGTPINSKYGSCVCLRMCVSSVCLTLSLSLARHRTETCEWFVRHPAVWFCLPRTWLAQRIHHTMERGMVQSMKSGQRNVEMTELQGWLALNDQHVSVSRDSWHIT